MEVKLQLAPRTFYVDVEDGLEDEEMIMEEALEKLEEQLNNENESAENIFYEEIVRVEMTEEDE